MTSGTPPNWKMLATPPANSLAALAADPPASDPLAVWKKWCAGMTIIDAVSSALCTLIQNGKIPLPKKIAADIEAGLYGLNEALVDVDAAFLAYINSGGTNTFGIDPPPIDTWPAPGDIPKHSDLPYFKSALEAIGGALTFLSAKIETALSTHPELQPAYAALTVLVSKEDAVLAAIKEVLNPS